MLTLDGGTHRSTELVRMTWEDKMIPFEEDKALGDLIVEDERTLDESKSDGLYHCCW